MTCSGVKVLKTLEYLTMKVALKCNVYDRTDLVFGVRWGFIGRSVRAGLHVSVCSGYDFCHPG